MTRRYQWLKIIFIERQKQTRVAGRSFIQQSPDLPDDYSELRRLFADDEDCQECEVILESLENIDDEADLYGIDFVKSDEPATAKHYHIYNTPALVYFRRQNPVTFEGDLTDEEAILDWLTSQEVFSIGDEIEEVNRKMLEKLLEENDFVAVYFCKSKQF